MRIESYNNTYNPNFKAGTPANFKKMGFIARNYDKATDAIAHGEGWLAGRKWMRGLIDYLKDKNYQQHIVAAVGLVLSSFYMVDTAKSKTIEKDQKMPLIMNQGIVTLASTLGGYTLDNYLSKKLNKFTETFNIANITDKKLQSAVLDMHAKKGNLEKSDFENLFKFVKNQAENREYEFAKDIEQSFDFNGKVLKQLQKESKLNPADNVIKKVLEEVSVIAKKDPQRVVKMNEIFVKHMKDSKVLKGIFSKQGFSNALKLVTNEEKSLSQLMTGLKIAKSLMVFGLIYRFVSPVIATPIANSLSARVEKKKKLKEGIKA